MLFLMISKHSPESCPFNNEKVKKITGEGIAKMDQINKKYGIKTVGMWVSMPEHHGGGVRCSKLGSSNEVFNGTRSHELDDVYHY